MAEFNEAISLDPNSFMEVIPVTLDSEGNIGTRGLPMLIKLSDFVTWLGSSGSDFSIPNATPATPGAVKAQTNIVALTNNSGGTSGGNTVAAVSDVATAANAIATLTVKLNAVIAAQVTAGQMVAP